MRTRYILHLELIADERYTSAHERLRKGSSGRGYPAAAATAFHCSKRLPGRLVRF